MKKFLLTCSLLASCFLSLNAQIIKSGNITASETWTNNNIYILNGWVYVKAGAVLTIQAGTVIKGDYASQGALIIERDAQLIANGTQDMPIVFTSQKSPGQRSYGDWGGVILCGRGGVNQPANASLGTQQGEAVVEGGVGTIYGGGTSPNDADNSGSLKYVRIEFPGIAFQPNSEINGLTCCGVGSGTTLEHIQVSYSGDDSYEWFGGAVTAKWLIAYKGWDDDFDTDFGFHGKVQFALAVRDPNIADQSGSNGFESDNDATGTTNTPLTNPIFSNVTIVGPYVNNSTINSNYKRALHLRRNTELCVYNSVWCGYPTGLLIESASTQSNATNGLLQFQNNVLAQMSDTLAASTAANPNNYNAPFFIGDATANNGFWGTGSNANYNTTAQLMFTNTSDVTPNLTLQAGSPLLTGAAFTAPNLNNPFFTPVTYRGAFDGTNNWATCWTEWDCQNQPYTTSMNNAFTVTATASGPTTFCAGGSVTLDAGSYPGATFAWSNGDNTQTSVITTSGTYSCTVTKSNGCVSTSNPITVVVNPAPTTPTISASGPVTFCNGGSVTLTSSQASGIMWSDNSTAASITVNSSGTYDVTYTDGNGCTATSAPTTVTVNANPAAPTVTANGSTSFCTGDSVMLTSSQATGNVWSPNGETTQSIYATASGTYSVTYTNSSNCSATSAATTVSVSNSPAPTVSITGSTSLCPGDDVTLTSSLADSYLWSNGATTQSITVNAAGTYFVTVTNSDPCNGVGASSSTTVTVLTAPTASFTYNVPVLNQYQFTNTSTGGTIYSWDFGDMNQSSAQNPMHIYTTSGTYTVTLTVTGANGCSTTTTQVLNVGVGVQEQQLLNGLTLYPNPANDNMNIDVNLNDNTPVQVMVYDLSGKVIMSETRDLSTGRNTITYDVTGWSNGIYFVRITAGNSVNTVKEVINR